MIMKKYLFNIKYIVLVTCVAITSCVSDDLANVGDLEDITGPTPFYSVTDVSTSEFDCNDQELWAKYELKIQAGSNLSVNGTNYQWSVTPAEGVTLTNKNLPILQQTIDAALASVLAIESEISKLEFKIPCEADAAKAAVLQAQVDAFKVDLDAANAALSDETLETVAGLQAQISALPAATLNDQELIFSFPNPGDYTVALTVTDNLGKSASTEKIVTINEAVPTIPVPEIAEPSFEDNSLFDGSGDGRDSWRAPSSSRWGGVIQINTDSSGRGEGNDLPDGIQAAKFPADGARVGYQEIEVTPGATYVLTYFTAFEENTFGDLTVSIIMPGLNTIEEARLEENIITSRTDTNIGRVDNVFKKHALTFEPGENESVVILITNSGVESRLDAFDISVKQ